MPTKKLIYSVGDIRRLLAEKHKLNYDRVTLFSLITEFGNDVETSTVEDSSFVFEVDLGEE